MKTKAIIFLFTVLFCFSCKPSQTEIKGEIFVATQGGQSYKLGAVPVKIVKKGKVENLTDSEARFSVADFNATSDADGKFSVKVPSGEYVVIVEAKRNVVSKTENYFWRVNVNAQGEETKVSLNNQNMSDN